MKSLRSKILTYLLVPIIVAGVSYVLITYFLVKRDVDLHTQEEDLVNVERLSSVVQDLIINKNFEKLSQAVFDEKEAGLNVEYVAVFNEEGQAIAHTFLGTLPGQVFDSSVDINEVKIFNQTIGQKSVLSIDKPIFIGLHKIGVLKVGYNLDESREELRKALYLYIILGSVLLILTAILAISLSRLIIKPIEGLTEAAAEFSEGRFKKRTEVNTNDEIGKLSSVFNKMAQNLEDNRGVIEKESQATQAKIEELEAWQKATVGRELKMMELKEQIKKMKGEK